MIIYDAVNTMTQYFRKIIYTDGTTEAHNEKLLEWGNAGIKIRYTEEDEEWDFVPFAVIKRVERRKTPECKMTEQNKLETMFELVPTTSISSQTTALRLQSWFEEATGFHFEIRETAK